MPFLPLASQQHPKSTEQSGYISTLPQGPDRGREYSKYSFTCSLRHKSIHVSIHVSPALSRGPSKRQMQSPSAQAEENRPAADLHPQRGEEREGQKLHA
jgi:hypothetical protein